MPSLELKGENGDVLDLDYVAKHGRGIQVTAGVTGFGLPAVQTRWIEGAGNGATFRGRRVLPRDIDLLLTVVGKDHEDLQALLNRLARLLDGKVRLFMIEDSGKRWWIDTYWVGGGDYAYGLNGQGITDADLVITLRAGDPFWRSVNRQQKVIRAGGSLATSPTTLRSGISLMTAPSTGSGAFLDELVTLPVAASAASGEVALENEGDADSYPTWEIRGPGENFEAIAPDGSVLRWIGKLTADETLTIDFETGLVTKDGPNGVENAYAELDTAPQFWRVPPGVSTGQAILNNASPGSYEPGAALRENLLPNPSFKTVTGYTSAGGKLVATTSWQGQFAGYQGTTIGMTTATGTSRDLTVAGPAIPATPGKWYGFRAFMAADSGLSDHMYKMQMRLLGDPAGTDYPGPSGDAKDIVFYEGAFLTAIAQARPGDTSVQPSLYLRSRPTDSVIASGKRLWTDQWLLVEGDTKEEVAQMLADGYFDGDARDTTRYIHQWTGDPHASTSIQYATKLTGASRITVSWDARKWLMV